MMKFAALLLSGLASCMANADVYKCISPSGVASFSNIPCSPNEGTASLQFEDEPPAKRNADRASADVVRSNLRAAEIMSQSRATNNREKTQVTIVGDSSKEPVKKGIYQRRKVTNCYSTRSSTNCIDNMGGSSTTIHSGRSSTTVSDGY